MPKIYEDYDDNDKDFYPLGSIQTVPAKDC
jgi:hypothetical protein